MYILRLGKMWLFIACAAIAAFIANQNLAEITINLRPFVSYPLVFPAYQALFFTFLLGTSTTMLFLGAAYYRKVFVIRRLNKKLLAFGAQSSSSPYNSDVSAEVPDELGISRPRVTGDFLSARD